MPRIRSLKPEIHTNRKTGPLSDRDFRLFVGCITQADDEGRLVADVAQLRVVLFPYHPKVRAADVGAGLERLAALGLIQIYMVDGTQYAWLPRWGAHQRIHKNHWTASYLPGPPAPGTSPGPVPDQSRTSPVGRDRKDRKDRIGREGIGEGNPNTAGDVSPATPSVTVVPESNHPDNGTSLAALQSKQITDRIQAQHPDWDALQVSKAAVAELYKLAAGDR